MQCRTAANVPLIGREGGGDPWELLGAGRHGLGSLSYRGGNCGGNRRVDSRCGRRRFCADLATRAAEGLHLCKTLLFLVNAHGDELDDRLGDAETALQFRTTGPPASMVIKM